MSISREQLLKPVPRAFAVVEVPELGAAASVRVQSLSAVERGAWEKVTYAAGQTVDMTNYRLQLCKVCVVDDEGVPLLEESDLPAFGAQPSAVVERVFQAAAKLNGLLGSNVDAIEKTSAAQSESETSGS